MGCCTDVLTSPACPVVIALFFHSLCIIGIVKSIGILFEDMAISLNTTVAEFGLSVGIVTFCSFFPAPIFVIVYRTELISRRISLFFGSTMIPLGMSLASLANNSGQVSACLMISGLGLCLLQTYLAMILNERTENFNLLYPLASSGYGVGMILPPLLAQLLQTAYGWRAAMLLLGALMANIIPCVLIIRGRYTHPGYNGHDRTRKESSQMHDSDHRGTSQTMTSDKHAKGERSISGSESDYDSERHLVANGPTKDDYGTRTRDIPLQEMSLGKPQGQSDFNGSNKDLVDADIRACADLGAEEHHTSTSMREKYYHDYSSEFTESDDSSGQFVSESQTVRTRLTARCHSTTPASTVTSTNKKKSLKSRRRYHSNKESERYMAECEKESCVSRRLSQSSKPRGGPKGGVTMTKDAKNGGDYRTFFEKIRDFLLNSPYYIDPWGNFAYISLLVNGFVYSGWHGFLVPHAMERGFTPYFVLIITSIAALGNFLGRVVAGIFTHRIILPVNLYLILCPVNLLALLGYTYITNIFAMCFMSFWSGISIAGRTKLPKMTARERAPLDKYFYIFPIMLICQGLGCLFGGIVSGLVANYFGTYDAIFKMLACVEVIVFFTMLPVRLAKIPEY